MKRNHILATAVAVFSLVSCNKEEIQNRVPDSKTPETRTELTVNIGGLATKATAVAGDATDEKKVASMQVLVFNGDNLDAYATSASSSTTVSCTAGSRLVYVIVNAPSLATISSKTALLATVSSLSDNSLTNFVMSGSATVTLPHAGAVSIDVNRLASRVVVKEIVRNFSSAALSSLSFKVDKIYLVNAAGNTTFAGAASSSWLNLAENKNECPTLLLDSPAATVANNASHNTAHYFYAYPNNKASHTTRLVIETTLGSTKYYYPIDMPAMVSNTSYEINKVTITRPGSSSPDVPVSFQDASFEINIVNWTTSNLTNETI